MFDKSFRSPWIFVLMSDKSNVGLSSFFPLGSPIWAVEPPINAEKYFKITNKYQIFYPSDCDN